MPVFFLVDCSVGMAGAPIKAVEQGIQMLHNELLGQPQAIEMVSLGVIMFGTGAAELVPLTPVVDFAPPMLSARGRVDLGAALHVLAEAIQCEVRPVSLGHKGDYRALVVLILSEVPTDEWRGALADLRSRCGERLGEIVAVGCGDAVDADVLREITIQVLLMTDVTSDNLRAFFRWTSQPFVDPDTRHAGPGVRGKESSAMVFDLGSQDVRRMPVYLLLDVSGSMAGAPIQAVEQGVQMLQNELLGQPQAVEMVHVSVITFGSSANQIAPLTSITSFTPPSLSAGGVTALGGALRLLGQALDREIAPTTAERKGDYKPLVFLLTDGEPTDAWEAELDALKARRERKAGSIIALGCGDGVNTDVLRRITDQVLLMTDVTSDNLRAFFKWVSASVTMASQSAAAPAGGGVANLPPPPTGFQVVL